MKHTHTKLNKLTAMCNMWENHLKEKRIEKSCAWKNAFCSCSPMGQKNIYKFEIWRICILIKYKEKISKSQLHKN